MQRNSLHPTLTNLTQNTYENKTITYRPSITNSLNVPARMV